MVRFTSIALSALLVQIASGQSIRAANVHSNVARNLSYDRIAGYEPNSKVTDHNALDRDQKFMEIELSKGTPTGLARAKRIYQEGGNSKSYAEITLSVVLPAAIQDKTVVTGTSVGDELIFGKVMSAEGNQRIVKIQYDTSQNQATWVGCRVGGLNEGRETNGCFKDSGTIVIDGKSYQYTYDSTVDNKNGRTLQGFSTAVESKMIACGTAAGCPMKDAKFFTDYYGQANYGDLWIQAAFNGGSLTNFDYGNTNFSSLGYSAQSELIKKGTVCMNTFMYVIREFEDAIADCRSQCDTSTNCNDDPVHAWDEGVAFYAGSLEGLDGYSSGRMLHQLADKRCRNFKTCGLNGDLDGPTTSSVNHGLLKLFNRGKEQLLSNQCAAARPTVQEIASLMYIPLIQGTLRYAYFLQTGDRNEKQRAEGAVFAASVVPRVHAASASAASIISSNMSLEATITSFSSVKTAFESVYAELGITCRQVGGIVNSEGMYYPGAEPCASGSDDDSTSDDGSDDDTSGCSDDKTASDDGSDDDKAASTDDGSDDDKEKASTDDGSDDDKEEASTDDGSDDDKEKAATDDGSDDDKAAAADDGTDDDGAGCSGVGSTGISTVVLLLSMVSAFVVL